MGLIRLILIILAIYLAFKYIIKPLLRVFIQRVIKKAVEREMGRFGEAQRPQRKEGSIHVDYIPDENKPKSPSNKTDGEYIDYEEIK